MLLYYYSYLLFLKIFYYFYVKCPYYLQFTINEWQITKKNSYVYSSVENLTNPDNENG